MAKPNLRCAANEGDLIVIQELLDEGADIHEKSRPSGCYLGGNTALHIAVSNNQVLAAELLLEKGANPNEAGGNYWFPLDQAVRLGNIEMFSLLLKYGAEPRNANNRGFTCLHHIGIWGRLAMAQIIVEGNYSVNINAKDDDDLTPLTCTKIHRRTRTATYLHGKGAVE